MLTAYNNHMRAPLNLSINSLQVIPSSRETNRKRRKVSGDQQ